ncbi:MAG: hypothetical protein ACYCSQ_05375 [bacterium]
MSDLLTSKAEFLPALKSIASSYTFFNDIDDDFKFIFSNPVPRVFADLLMEILNDHGFLDCNLFKNKREQNRINEGINNGLIELPVKHIPTTPKGQRERKLTSGCTEYVRKVYASGGMDNASRLDFKAAMYAAKKGFSEADIAEAIKTFSPGIETRKKGTYRRLCAANGKKCFNGSFLITICNMQKMN